MTFQSYQDIMLWRPPPMKEAIEGGILYQGTKLILFGLPKRHKSITVQQMAFCVAVGAPWLGFKTERMVVGYVQGEVPPAMFRKRVLKMGQNQKVPNGSIFFLTTTSTLKLDRQQGLDVLCKSLERTKPQLLILDPIWKYTSNIAEETLLNFVDNMDYLIHHFGLSIVLTHHSRKEKDSVTGQTLDHGGSELRGPVLEAWADSIIRIQGPIESAERMLDFELRHAEDVMAPITIKLDRKRLWFVRS
jgi:RecA-family ATPase